MASLAVEVGADGFAERQWANGRLGRESAVFATALEVDVQRYAIDSTEVSVVNPSAAVTTIEEAHARHAALEREQEARYA